MKTLLLALAIGVPLVLLAPACGGSSGPPELVGTWRGINGTAGELRIGSDGHYSYSVGNGGGEIQKTADNKYKFTGTLAAWGNAHLFDKDTLVFNDDFPIEFDFAKISN
jgi:hypothetical protein